MHMVGYPPAAVNPSDMPILDQPEEIRDGERIRLGSRRWTEETDLIEANVVLPDIRGKDQFEGLGLVRSEPDFKPVITAAEIRSRARPVVERRSHDGSQWKPWSVVGRPRQDTVRRR